MGHVPTGRLLSQKNIQKNQDKPKEKKLPKIEYKDFFTALLAILVSVVGFCYISWLTGNDLTDTITFFDTRGFEKTFFIMLIITIVLIGVKMDILSWKTIRNLLITGMVIMFFHLLGASIWPSWNPRGYLQGEGKVVNQTPETKEGELKGNPLEEEKRLVITSPAVFTFPVKPYEKIYPSLFVAEGLRYNISSENEGDDFFIFAEGETIHINGKGKIIPKPIGEFSLMNGSKVTTLTILITKT